MIKRLFSISIALFTFAIGVYFAVINWNSTKFSEPTNNDEPTIFKSVPIYLPEETVSESALAFLKINEIISYKKAKGKQTIYLSKDFDFAYWVEDKSIYNLNVIENPEHVDWFYYKAHIDLTKQVVPAGKYRFLGCCLYEKDWVDKTISKCKKGRKIIL